MKTSRSAPSRRALIVDPDATTRRAAARALMAAAITPLTAESVDTAVALITSAPVDVVLLGAELLGHPPRDAIVRLRAAQPNLAVIVTISDEELHVSSSLAARDDIDILRKPPPIAELWAHAAQRGMEAERESEVGPGAPVDESPIELIGASPSIRRLFQIAHSAADSENPILLLGESGTGRSLLARSIHRHGRRRAGPFVSFSCSAPREQDRERLLFGDAPGRGALAAADRGTIHLDDIAHLPLAAQRRLAIALEAGLGTRVLASGPPDLAAHARKGEFLDDLYYRLSVIELLLPPLRRRRDDLPLLAHHFLRLSASRHAKSVQRLSADATRALLQRSWPGNLSELSSVIERAVLLAPGPTLYPADLPSEEDRAEPLDERAEAEAAPPSHVELPYADAKERALEDFHRVYMGELLRRAGGNLSEAARRAGLDRANFRRVLRRFEQLPPRKKR